MTYEELWWWRAYWSLRATDVKIDTCITILILFLFCQTHWKQKKNYFIHNSRLLTFRPARNTCVSEQWMMLTIKYYDLTETGVIITATVVGISSLSLTFYHTFYNIYLNEIRWQVDSLIPVSSRRLRAFYKSSEQWSRQKLRRWSISGPLAVHIYPSLVPFLLELCPHPTEMTHKSS